MTDDRLKIWIELGKWAVVSVGLVIMTKIIDTGFKDREVGLNEIREYDKYVSLVTDNTKISERRLLAQFFAHVTPSETLRDGWNSYFNTVNYEYESLIKEKEMIQEQLTTLRDSFTGVLIDSQKVIKLEEKIHEIDDELKPTFKKNNSNYTSALHWEKMAFEYLFNKDLNQAIEAFQNSENEYNSFHQVYEIARFLRSKEKADIKRDETFWKTIYKTILENYSWKMPVNVKTKFEHIIAKDT